MTQPTTGAGETHGRLLWFAPVPEPESGRRPTLTRQRVVAEALAIISANGIQSLTMRFLATRLAVVPGALYRHVSSKEQLYDLVLDEVLGEIDLATDHASPWAERIRTLAQRLRSVLEDHPGIAGLLKSREPLTPHSLALAEAFLEPLYAAGPTPARAAMAYRLIHDFTVGFAVSDRASPSEQRLRDPTVREQLRIFLRSLPTDRFPRLTDVGELVWIDDRDERFAANLDTLVRGLQL